MVKANNYSVNVLVLVLSFLIILTSYQGLAEFFKATNIETPDCHGIYAAEAGDTCESLVKIFNLKAEHFSSINPNLNCNKIRMALCQWNRV
ncbi:hypothetical protein K7X08_032469 [Anisodus acutangulus]|uniref:LysM domain-containing protein n=1 Tax=Anisodus acutangulus TaxID=402998 RepID=A0A9Q1MUZ4_9SOLA|nr:hypothetical protein K7X08_032469 [Anisodus acutangulus]